MTYCLIERKKNTKEEGVKEIGEIKTPQREAFVEPKRWGKGKFCDLLWSGLTLDWMKNTLGFFFPSPVLNHQCHSSTAVSFVGRR